MKKYLWILIILPFFSCKSTDEAFFKDGKAPLMGIVYDHEDVPLKDALITIVTLEVVNDSEEVADSTEEVTESLPEEEEEEPEIITVRTDLNGRFLIPELSRGEHQFTVEKEGCETAVSIVTFTDVKQVLFIKLYTLDNLLVLAQDGLDRKNFKEAMDYLNRAEKIKNDDAFLHYLKAFAYIGQGEYINAETQLTNLVKEGNREPYILLLLADVYQYYLLDNTEAAMYLKEYLKFKKDKSNTERLKELENEID